MIGVSYASGRTARYLMLALATVSRVVVDDRVHDVFLCYSMLGELSFQHEKQA